MSRTLLIVEDHTATRDLLRELFGMVGDYEITEAANGAEALTHLRERTYDAMTTDGDMPRMNGDELLETARNENRLPGKYAMISANASKLQAMKEELPDIKLVSKPVDFTAIKQLSDHLSS
ncbi:hypothetical protein CMI48_03070 [Candidatus Pacearchaeota archaeon]|nr:hypothetical protein [Candidatus Pacearchaeota archaeon]|tara:strand:+ start:697 stop:1059 length:363 start_codon:yes stop_codon:yes gene_type:complete